MGSHRLFFFVLWKLNARMIRRKTNFSKVVIWENGKHGLLTRKAPLLHTALANGAFNTALFLAKSGVDPRVGVRDPSGANEFLVDKTLDFLAMNHVPELQYPAQSEEDLIDKGRKEANQCTVSFRKDRFTAQH